MKGACAVVIDDNKAYLCFGLVKKHSFKFIEEQSLTFSKPPTDLVSCIKENIEAIDQAIVAIQKRNRLKINQVFLELPQSLTNTRTITEFVPLKGKKRISSLDIHFIKKYLEDKFLDWDDYCIHNIGLSYKARDITYQSPPYGLWAKRLSVKALLVSIKDKTYKEIEDIFDNFGRHFAGFTCSMLSSYASVFAASTNRLSDRVKPQVVMRSGYKNSNIVIRKENDFIFLPEVDFGLKRLMEKFSQRFFLDFNLAEEVFERYISFKEIPYFKEITIKRDSGYVNLSTQTMNLFVKEYLRGQIAKIFELIRPQVGSDDFVFSFLGNLGRKEGFYAFLRDCVSCDLASPLEQSAATTSFGCLRYSLFPFLELGYLKNRSLLQRIVDVYREYF